MADCIFCRIIDGELEASIVWQDSACTVFMDIQPVNPGHMLVVPNVHAAYLADLDGKLAGRLMRVAHRMAAALRSSGVRCEGVNLFLADGEAAMQEVLHTHLHVFPRYVGDGFGLQFGPHYTDRPDRGSLAVVAAQIRAALTA